MTTRKTTANGEAESDGLKIIFTPDAWAKMWAYTFSVEDEISGYGKVSVQNGVFTVSDVAIFEQEVSGADTEISAASVAKFIHELHRRGEDASQWRLWWHSHNRMNVFWSGTDEHAMSPENNIGRDWLLSTVVNFRREILGRLDVYAPVHCTIDNIPVETDESVNIPEEIRTEVAAKVKRRPAAQVVGFDWQKWNAERDVPGVPSRIPTLPYSSYMDEDELEYDYNRKPLEDFGSLGLEGVVTDTEYELCRKYWEGEKQGRKQKQRARELLQMWGITVKHINE